MKAAKHAPYAFAAALIIVAAVLMLWRASRCVERLTSPGLQIVGNVLRNNPTLASGQAMQSPNKKYMFAMQADGNAVLYETTPKASWSTGTKTPGSKLIVQSDGNVVVYSPDSKPLWASQTYTKYPNGPHSITLGDGGDLRVNDYAKRLMFFRMPTK
jgi:hypothetical protein